MNEFVSTHKLSFFAAPDPVGQLTGLTDLQRFKIGTCSGQWGCTDNEYYILSVINKAPGNGHFDDVLEWFENSCQRDDRNLLIMEIMEDRFYKHLISKRKFVPLDPDGSHVIRVFNVKKYIDLKRNGSEFLEIRGNLGI